MNWDECYQKGEVPWDKGAPAPAMKQYLARHTVGGRALVPGCGRGHEVALAVEHGLDATGLDIAPTAAAEARAVSASGDALRDRQFVRSADRDARRL